VLQQLSSSYPSELFTLFQDQIFFECQSPSAAKFFLSVRTLYAASGPNFLRKFGCPNLTPDEPHNLK
ncbi:MAG: hypothetical protein U9R43_01230, partial [Thermodesulfobacteriota bacterium]|nr:hypothetical protein [Thermodesulfobacteriota bacterium]